MRVIIFSLSIICAFTSNAQIKRLGINYGSNYSDSDIIVDAILSNYEDSIEEKDIVSFDRVIQNKVEIIRVQLDERLPEVIYKSMSIILFQGKSYTLDLNDAYCFTIPNSQGLYIGGTYIYRGKGNYHFYKITDGIVRQIFRSSVSVFDDTNGCKSYSNKQLKLKRLDLNNDGYLDFQFTGLENNYCSGEQSIRLNDTIVDKKSIDVRFLYLASEDSFQEITVP